MLLSQFLVSYSLQRELTESSVEQYRIAINCFDLWIGHKASIEELTDDAVNQFLIDYGRNRRPHTVTSKRRSLLVLWRAIADQHEITAPKRIRKIKTSPTPRDVWSAADVKQIVLRLRYKIGRLPKIGVRSGDYFAGLVLAAWETGLRLADLVNLTRDHLSKPGWFGITMQKTQLPHWCKLHDQTRHLILGTFDDAPPRALCWPDWDARTAKAGYKHLRAEIMKAAEAVGLSASDGPFKKLRRSSVTAVEMIAAGQGQFHAGHTSAVTTQRWYLSDETRLNRPIPQEIPV
jgi:integrase